MKKNLFIGSLFTSIIVGCVPKPTTEEEVTKVDTLVVDTVSTVNSVSVTNDTISVSVTE